MGAKGSTESKFKIIGEHPAKVTTKAHIKLWFNNNIARDTSIHLYYFNLRKQKEWKNQQSCNEKLLQILFNFVGVL